MSKIEIPNFEKILPVSIETFDRYIPSAFNENFTILQKITRIIKYINTIGDITNEMMEKWDEIVRWILEDGVSDAVIERLNEMLEDGTLASIINEVLFGELNNRITHLENNHYPIELFPRLENETSDDMRIKRAIDTIPENSVLVFNPRNIYEINNTILIESKTITIDVNNAELKTIKNGLDMTFRFLNCVNPKILKGRFNQNQKGRTSIEFYQCSNIVVNECYFTGYSKEYDYYQTDGGIRLQDTVIGKISNSTWENHGDQYGTNTSDLNRCISIQGTLTDHIIVSGNTFKNVNQAIVVSCGYSNLITGNTFDTIKDNSLYILSGVKGIEIAGNSFYDKFDESIVMAGENINITGNDFRQVPNKVFAINGNIINLNISSNNIMHDGNLAQIIAYRQPTYTIDGFVFANNSIDVKNNNNGYVYFDIQGSLVNFVITDNVIKMNTVDYQDIFKFGGSVDGKIMDNVFSFTYTTTSLLNVTNANVTGNIFFYDNLMKGCRVSTSNNIIVLKGMNVQSNVPYANTLNTNSVFFTDSTPVNGRWKKGDIALNSSATTQGFAGWICTDGDGTSLGTWEVFGKIGGARTRNGTPVNWLSPNYLGDICIDTSSGDIYMGIVIGDQTNGWKLLS